MKSVSIVLACCCFTGIALANEATNQAPNVSKAYIRNGGRLPVPGSQKGKIAIFNAQKLVATKDYWGVIDSFQQQHPYKFESLKAANVTPMSAQKTMADAGAQVAVFLVEDPANTWTTLVAPDGRWSIVNVDAVVKDARNEIFAAARTRKALMRAFLFAAGAANSQYPGSALAPIIEAKDYDKLIEDPPLDAVMRAEPVMRKVGLTPQEDATYRTACQEGWAPKPADKYQQKIWDDVHAMPTKPIKIEK